MIDPYKMIVVNLAALFILTTTVLLYKLANPKKKINLLYILICLASIASISIFRTGSYESGDFNIHIYRSMEFYRSLSEGNFIPSWAPNLNATYGYPLFIFNYSLPYYLTSFFHFIGFSFINSLKLFLAANMLFSAIFMYAYVKEKFKNRLASFTAGVFYVFFPYHLITVHFKITIGEILSYTLIPLVFLFLDKFIAKKKTYYLIAAGLILGLIAMSHIFIAIFLLPLLLVYLASYLRNIKKVLTAIIIIILPGALVSAYQWIPPILYANELFISKYPVDSSALYFPSLSDLAYSIWRYGLLFQGPKGEISYLIGYAQLILIASAIFILLKNKTIKQYKSELIVLLILFFSTILLIIPQSKPIWNSLAVLNAAGSHRLMLLIGFIIALVSAYLVIITKKKFFIYILLLLAIGSTILNWGQRRVIPEINDKVLEKNLTLSTSQGEAHFYANTKYVDKKNPWFKVVPDKKIEALEGEIKFASIERKSTKHAYNVEVSKKSILSEKTLYFPGWRVYADKKEIRAFPGKNGEINFNLSRGNYDIQLVYDDIFKLKVAKLISIVAFLGFFFYLLLKFKPHKIK